MTGRRKRGALQTRKRTSHLSTYKIVSKQKNSVESDHNPKHKEDIDIDFMMKIYSNNHRTMKYCKNNITDLKIFSISISTIR